mmetsp:Transcript_2042/g.3679  ORF Transcript_2042/g.3679 Transcript_2042/m.3679 type:complete len:163 (-) Transcript_2042:32-520(-)
MSMHHDSSAPTQNVGNSLGSRPVIRQSKYFRQYESGNATKSLLGMSNLQWDTEKTEGCFSGGRVHDEYRREAAAHDEYLQLMQSQSQGQTDAELLQLQQRQHYVQQQQQYEQPQPNNNKNRDALDVFISSHSPPPQRPQKPQKPEPQNDSRWQTTSQSYGSF